MSLLADPLLLMLGGAIAALAGFVKGIAGFGLPAVLLSLLSLLVPIEVALASLIVPTLVTNAWQAGRQGVEGIGQSVRKYRWFMGVSALFLCLSAQLFRVFPDHIMSLLIGGAVAGFALWQLFRQVKPAMSSVTVGLTMSRQVAFGVLTGIMAGLTGIWGPPTVAMLLLANTPKHEQVRLLGIIFFSGAVLMLFAHIGSGVVTVERLVFSALLVPPALLGQALGLKIMDRIDQMLFRRVVLLVLLLTAANLLRRGLMGI